MEYVKVLFETPIELALFGLGLSHGITSKVNYEDFDLSNPKFARILKIAKKLAPLDKGHNKFLESIVVFLDVEASRAWWQEFDTYRVGMTKQSESTMHTLKKQHLTYQNFTRRTTLAAINLVNELIDFNSDISLIKDNLPEGFLQRRIICTNYKALKNIFSQRLGHKYPFWDVFIKSTLSQLTFSFFLEREYD